MEAASGSDKVKEDISMWLEYNNKESRKEVKKWTNFGIQSFLRYESNVFTPPKPTVESVLAEPLAVNEVGRPKTARTKRMIVQFDKKFGGPMSAAEIMRACGVSCTTYAKALDEIMRERDRILRGKKKSIIWKQADDFRSRYGNDVL